MRFESHHTLRLHRAIWATKMRPLSGPRLSPCQGRKQCRNAHGLRNVEESSLARFNLHGVSRHIAVPLPEVLGSVDHGSPGLSSAWIFIDFPRDGSLPCGNDGRPLDRCYTVRALIGQHLYGMRMDLDVSSSNASLLCDFLLMVQEKLLQLLFALMDTTSNSNSNTFFPCLVSEMAPPKKKEPPILCEKKGNTCNFPSDPPSPTVGCALAGVSCLLVLHGSLLKGTLLSISGRDGLERRLASRAKASKRAHEGACPFGHHPPSFLFFCVPAAYGQCERRRDPIYL